MLIAHTDEKKGVSTLLHFLHAKKSFTFFSSPDPLKTPVRPVSYMPMLSDVTRAHMSYHLPVQTSMQEWPESSFSIVQAMDELCKKSGEAVVSLI